MPRKIIAVRDPEIEAIAPLDLNTDALDEVGDLARSFEELHDSLVEVSARQMKALRGGVSSIIVTLARRNTSLVDRQLALLDELESREEDPNVLGAYYKLDHFATRMRRNAESVPHSSTSCNDRPIPRTSTIDADAGST